MVDDHPAPILPVKDEAESGGTPDGLTLAHVGEGIAASAGSGVTPDAHLEVAQLDTGVRLRRRTAPGASAGRGCYTPPPTRASRPSHRPGAPPHSPPAPSGSPSPAPTLVACGNFLSSGNFPARFESRPAGARDDPSGSQANQHPVSQPAVAVGLLPDKACHGRTCRLRVPLRRAAP